MKEIALHALDIAQNSTAAQANWLDISLSEDEGQISLTIADNGRGMSPQLLAQVSDPFTTTRTTRKMGLGLPLLRMAAEQTGGVMSIDSTEGVGTTVTAVFSAQHIDCPPVGDMGTTITFLLQGNPDLHLCYRHTVNGRHFLLDTDELHAQLGPDISLAEPEVILWIRDYLQEQELLLRENEEMKT